MCYCRRLKKSFFFIYGRVSTGETGNKPDLCLAATFYVCINPSNVVSIIDVRKKIPAKITIIIHTKYILHTILYCNFFKALIEIYGFVQIFLHKAESVRFAAGISLSNGVLLL